MITRLHFRSSLVIVTLSLLIALFPLSSLTAEPALAQAVEGTFFPTTVRCWSGEYTYKVNVQGAYQGQWGAIRHHLWGWISGKGWVYIGVTGWEVAQLPGPNTIVVGGNMTVAADPGSSIKIATDVTFWNGAWGKIYSLPANHYQFEGPYSQTFCST
jgi:hypothetical protein